MNFVADTHALIWWFIESQKLSLKVSEIFEKCESGDNLIFIPSIVITESLSIFDKKRVTFNFRSLFRKIHTSDNFIIIPLDVNVLQKMIDLKEIPELHDKIIVATAKQLKVPILTKDKILQKFPGIKSIW